MATTLSSSAPAQWAQAFFILASCLVLAVAALPEKARRPMLDYGARTSKSDKADLNEDGKHARRAWLDSLVTMLTSWGQVPHSWFMSFYTTSLTCSVFWLVQYLTDGRVLRFLAARQVTTSTPETSMRSGQVVLLWIMMFLQASRRLYEHLTLFKSSKSTMWVVHWVLGIVYYTCMGLSVWVEGSGKTPQAFPDMSQSLVNRYLQMSSCGGDCFLTFKHHTHPCMSLLSWCIFSLG
jgi:3-oxo-5-alpha-steroid 4-dehydrogenase 3